MYKEEYIRNITLKLSALVDRFKQ